jgi:hypothetical protein
MLERIGQGLLNKHVKSTFKGAITLTKTTTNVTCV